MLLGTRGLILMKRPYSCKIYVVNTSFTGLYSNTVGTIINGE